MIELNTNSNSGLDSNDQHKSMQNPRNIEIDC